MSTQRNISFCIKWVKRYMTYMVALRNQAIHCNFGNYLDMALRNQFVFGLRDKVILNRLLEKEHLKVDDVVPIAKAIEMSRKRGAKIQGKQEISQAHHLLKRNKTLEKVGTKSDNNFENESNKNKCFRCGGETHLANRCIHKNSTCNYCHKKGHIQKVCFKAKQNTTNLVEDEQIVQNNVEVMCNISNK